LAITVVNNADRRGESQLQRAFADRERIVRVADAAAHYRVDVYVKLRVFGQQLQLLVEHLEALLRYLVGHDVVDRDLEMFQPGTVEPLDSLRHQQVPVGDHPGDHAAAAYVRNDQIQIGMQQRLAAADGNDVRAQIGQVIQPLVHRLNRNRLRYV